MIDNDGSDDSQAALASLADAHPEDPRVVAELTGFDDGSDPLAVAVRTTRMPMVITDRYRRECGGNGLAGSSPAG